MNANHDDTERTKHRTRVVAARHVVMLTCILALSFASAQEGLRLEGSLDESEGVAVVSLGASAGFPAYRSGRISASVQTGLVGLAVHGSLGPTGLAGGLDVRLYAPLPLPVPAYVGAGIDLYAERVAPHVLAGVHLPFAESWRLDAEFGAGWATLLDEVQVVPIVSVGVSYAFTTQFEGSESNTSGQGNPPAPASVTPACTPRDADPALLDDALRAATRRFLLDATALYGSIYRDLTYELSVTRQELDIERATLFLAYEGTVIQRFSGEPISAAGSAEVDFIWTGCSWRRGALRY